MARESEPRWCLVSKFSSIVGLYAKRYELHLPAGQNLCLAYLSTSNRCCTITGGFPLYTWPNTNISSQDTAATIPLLPSDLVRTVQKRWFVARTVDVVTTSVERTNLLNIAPRPLRSAANVLPDLMSSISTCAHISVIPQT